MPAHLRKDDKSQTHGRLVYEVFRKTTQQLQAEHGTIMGGFTLWPDGPTGPQDEIKYNCRSLNAQGATKDGKKEMNADEKAFIRAIVAVWSHKRRNSCFSCLVLTIDEAWQAYSNKEPIEWND